jgi:hypothetical protein
MFRRRNRHTDRPRLFVQEPAEAIRRIVLAGRCPLTSRIYRQQMAVVDAALFTHPDYGPLTHLAAAVIAENGDQHQ